MTTNDWASAVTPFAVRHAEKNRRPSRTKHNELTISDEALPPAVLIEPDRAVLCIDTKMTRVNQETTDDE